MAGLPRWLVACLALAAVWLAAATGRADADSAPSLEAGREAEVLALFAPFTLGGEVTPGWRLMDVAIGARSIRCVVEAPAGGRAAMTLAHPSSAPGARTSRSFAIVLEPDGHAALAALAARVVANDPGGFFRVRLPPPRADVGSNTIAAPRSPLVSWMTDGVVLLAALAALTFALAWRELADAPRWTRWAALGVLALAAGVRLALSVDAALDVWPYSRLLPLGRQAFFGPLLSGASRALGATWPLVDVVHTTNLVVAILTPLAVLSHARPLLGDHRAGLLAAALVAVAPAHVRFSRSDTAFVPALLLSALAFGLAHRAACDRSARVRFAAIVGLPLLVLVMLTTRPLNVLFLPLLLGQLWLLDGRAPRRRLLWLGAVTTVTGAAFFFGPFLREHERTIAGSIDAGLPLRIALAVVTPRLDTLLHPSVTPPLLLLVAGLGAVTLSRRGGGRRVGFLGAWIALFFAGHAVVLPSSVEMQARYQLHLVVPVAMLGGAGLVALMERRAWLGALAAVVLAASPALHAKFVREVGFDDLREHELVRRASAGMTEGCTVLEHVEHDQDARFVRMGLALVRGTVTQRLRVQPLGADGGARLREEAAALLREPPACLYLYEGLPCRGGAPACRAARDAARWEVVVEARFPSRPYDDTLAVGMPKAGSEVELSLRRLAR